jgi:hypothetical protein
MTSLFLEVPKATFEADSLTTLQREAKQNNLSSNNNLILSFSFEPKNKTQMHRGNDTQIAEILKTIQADLFVLCNKTYVHLFNIEDPRFTEFNCLLKKQGCILSKKLDKTAKRIR